MHPYLVTYMCRLLNIHLQTDPAGAARTVHTFQRDAHLSNVCAAAEPGCIVVIVVAAIVLQSPVCKGPPCPRTRLTGLSLVVDVCTKTRRAIRLL